MSVIQNPCFFNGYDLTSVPGLTVLSTNPYIPPQRKINIADIIRTDRAKATSAFYTKRQISVKVGITAGSRALIEQALDSLMAMLQGVEKELIMNQGAGQRKYFATLSDAVINASGGSYLEITLVFECSDRFGYDLQSTLALIVSYTATANIVFAGSAPWQAPIITITFSAVTGGTSKDVVVGNGVTNQKVTINRTWVAGDVLVIDTLAGTVKVNGVEVAFSGALPLFTPGTGVFTYADTLSTRTLTGEVRYNKRYV